MEEKKISEWPIIGAFAVLFSAIIASVVTMFMLPTGKPGSDKDKSPALPPKPPHTELQSATSSARPQKAQDKSQEVIQKTLEFLNAKLDQVRPETQNKSPFANIPHISTPLDVTDQRKADQAKRFAILLENLRFAVSQTDAKFPDTLFVDVKEFVEEVDASREVRILMDEANYNNLERGAPAIPSKIVIGTYLEMSINSLDPVLNPPRPAGRVK